MSLHAMNPMEGQIQLGCSASNTTTSTCFLTEGIATLPNVKYFFLVFILAAFILELSWPHLRNKKNLPPFAPGGLPILGHALFFLNQPAKLAAIISDPKTPKILRFKIPFNNMYFAAGNAELTTVFMNPKTYDFQAMKEFVQRKLFGLPDDVIRLTEQDNSGFSLKPLPGSHVSPHGRFKYLERKTSEDINRPASLAAFMEHFEESLAEWMEEQHCGVPSNGEWIEFPDLYLFIRGMVTKTATDAFCGPELLRLNPQLAQDFWEYDKNVPIFAKGFPRWMFPATYRVRDRCYKAFERWRANAFKESEKEDAKIPEWSQHAGLRINTLRDNMFSRFKEWTQGARANSDFALLFGLNANSVPAAFWFFIETWQNPTLFAEAVAEVQKCTYMENGKKRFDGKLLVENPLLQSIYSETLRIYVTILYLRTTLHDGELDGKTIPAGSKIMCCNWSQQMNEEVWNPTGDSKIPPASEFWGKRFLEYPDGDETKTPRFKAEDIGGGRWFPFSIGEHLCPGRNAAKREIILVFAVLATYFEVELLEEGKKPKPDLNRFGYGTLPPSGASACRIRRKVEEH